MDKFAGGRPGKKVSLEVPAGAEGERRPVEFDSATRFLCFLLH
jgi:hypothetical protein